MKLSQLLTYPNQLTLLRMSFLPFIVIKLVDGRYGVASILFVLAGMSDGLDGLLARALKQQTVLGQYLDPIADKMLLSTVFLVLSILHKIPWKFTVVVFSRDISILAASTVLFAIAGLRDFRPSVFGKANTFAQVAAVFFVLVAADYSQNAGSPLPVSPSCAQLSPSPLFRQSTTSCWSGNACTPTALPRPLPSAENTRHLTPFLSSP